MGGSGRSARRKQGRGAAVPAEDPDTGSNEAPLSFESALEQLEQTVTRLEEGDMPLEEALDLFEAGVQLSRQCSVQLDRAERRVEILVADREDGAAEPFDSDEDWDDALAGDGADDEALED